MLQTLEYDIDTLREMIEQEIDNYFKSMRDNKTFEELKPMHKKIKAMKSELGRLEDVCTDTRL